MNLIKAPVLSVKRYGKARTVFVVTGSISEGGAQMLERLGFKKRGDSYQVTARGFSMQDCADFLYYLHSNEGLWLDRDSAKIIQRCGLEVDNERVIE